MAYCITYCALSCNVDAFVSQTSVLSCSVLYKVSCSIHRQVSYLIITKITSSDAGIFQCQSVNPVAVTNSSVSSVRVNLGMELFQLTVCYSKLVDLLTEIVSDVCCGEVKNGFIDLGLVWELVTCKLNWKQTCSLFEIVWRDSINWKNIPLKVSNTSLGGRSLELYKNNSHSNIGKISFFQQYSIRLEQRTRTRYF